jgi:choline dehydrogenase-like flavoprotein
VFLTWPLSAEEAEGRIVVVGAGPAGLYLADRLSRRARVLLIDAGSLDNALDDGGPQYSLKITGRDYPESGTRLSAFGGTSNHWGGNTHPIAPELFAGGDEAAWPLPYSEYADQLEGARRFLNVADFEEDVPTPLDRGVLAGYASLRVRRFRESSPMVRLGDDAYVAAFRGRTDIGILMDTRVTDIVLAPTGDRVASLSLRHKPSGEAATIHPSTVVLAAGGIENARLMLWSGRNSPGGNPFAGGPNRLTGRNFTEKPYFSPVDFYLDSRADFAGVTPSETDSSYFAWEVADDVRRKNGLARFCMFPRAPAPADPSVETANAIYAETAPGYIRLDPAFQFEQSSYDQSYVSLASDLDVDGTARAELHWEISPADVAAYRKSVLMLCGLLAQKGAARAWLKPEYQGGDWSQSFLGFCNHHNGTTQMAATADRGVVDPDCRVFGLANLFVAGSSIFPPSGYVNPTLSIVALAGRLADHLGGLL